MDLPWKKKEENEGKEPTSEGVEAEKKPDEEESKKTQESSVPEPPTGSEEGVQTPFGGKSEEEVLASIALLEATVKEQGRALTEARDAQPATVVEPEPKTEDVDSTAYFQNPIGETRKMIQEELKTIVAPLREDFAKGRARNAWDDAADEIPNLANMRPLIEAGLARNGIANPTIAQIIGVRDMVVGQAERMGTPIPGIATVETKTEVRTEAAEAHNRVSPQHNPSSQPIVSTEQQAKIRDLTENEARMARERGMTHEEFLSWQGLDIADIVLPEEKEKVS